jgi:hypothetical protein
MVRCRAFDAAAQAGGLCLDTRRGGGIRLPKGNTHCIPVLQLLDFAATFVVDCDASGFGAVLHQGGRPIAFFRRAISLHHAKLAAYERELIGLVKAVRHWWPYLWPHPFIVRTNHYSLKYLLDQRLSTIPQHAWVSKLFGITSRWNSSRVTRMWQLMPSPAAMKTP